MVDPLRPARMPGTLANMFGQDAARALMIEGSVVGVDGQPAQLPILVYARGVGEVAMTRTCPDGRFEVRARPTGEVAKRVGANGGAVTLRVDAATDRRIPQAVTRVRSGVDVGNELKLSGWTQLGAGA